MKFELIYANPILKYLLNNIGTICEKDTCGNCDMRKFLIDLLLIFKFEIFPVKAKKKEVTKLLKKVKETNYNLTVKYFIERIDLIFM